MKTFRFLQLSLSLALVPFLTLRPVTSLKQGHRLSKRPARDLSVSSSKQKRKDGNSSKITDIALRPLKKNLKGLTYGISSFTTSFHSINLSSVDLLRCSGVSPPPFS